MAKKSRRTTRRPRPASGRASQPRMLFDRQNYVLLIGCVVLVVVGFAAMRIENELNGVISLYVAPLVILTGYLGVFYALLRRPKTDKPEADAA